MALQLREGGSHLPVGSTHGTLGRGVLLEAGAGSPDWFVDNLRDELRDVGYDAHKVHFRFKINTIIGVKNDVRRAAERLRERHDEPLAALGHSWGGRHLLELAYEDPELINFVGTYGSPLIFTGEKPDGVTVVNFIGRNGKFFDGLVPAFTAVSRNPTEKVKVRTGHFHFPNSREVFDATTHRLGPPTTTAPTRLRRTA